MLFSLLHTHKNIYNCIHWDTFSVCLAQGDEWTVHWLDLSTTGVSFVLSILFFLSLPCSHVHPNLFFSMCSSHPLLPSFSHNIFLLWPSVFNFTMPNLYIFSLFLLFVHVDFFFHWRHLGPYAQFTFDVHLLIWLPESRKIQQFSNIYCFTLICLDVFKEINMILFF